MEFFKEVSSFLSGFNVQNILAMIGIVWFFSRDIKSSIDKLDLDIRAMNTRLGRLEGTVYGKDVYIHTQEVKK